VLTKKLSHSAREIRSRLREGLRKMHDAIDESDFERAFNLATKIGKQASSFHLNEMAAEAYKYLTKYYLTISPSKFHYKKYKDKYNRFSTRAQHEMMVNDYYMDLASNFERRVNLSKEVKNLSLKYVNDIVRLEEITEHGPYFYHRYYFLLCLDRMIQEDYRGQLTIAEEAFSFFENQFLKFDLSLYKFYTIAADAQLSLLDFTGCDVYLSRADEIEVPQKSGYYTNLIVRSRLDLINGNDLDYDRFPTENIVFKEIDRKLKLLKIYDQILQGNKVETFEELNDYVNDPTGMGIALNVARILNARITEDELDMDNAMRHFLKNDIDHRSRILINALVYSNYSELDGLSKYYWNPWIEVIPYENILGRIIN